MDLDTIDRKIVASLQNDARISNAALADHVGLSPSACLRRVRALERSGVITGYRALADPNALGIGLTVIVHIGLQHHDDEALAGFEDAVKESPNILGCDMISGRDDYMLRVGAADISDYERVHREQLSKLPGVTRIESYFVLRTVAS